MAVDPLVRREQNRINKQNQRARDAARAAGKPIPRGVAKYPLTRAITRASLSAAEAQARRVAVIRSLPSARNPEVNIYVGTGRDLPRSPARLTRQGPDRQREAIASQARAQKLEAVGRGRRAQLLSELDDSDNSANYNKYLSPEQRERFQQLSKRIASIPLQALGILFDYDAGQNEYNSVIGHLTGSPDSVDAEEGLAVLATLAETADRARALYAPSAVVNGAKLGRLNV